VENMADMLSVTGTPSTTYCTCDSEPRGCMRPLSSVTNPGVDATMLSMARDGDAPEGRSSIDCAMSVSDEVRSVSTSPLLSEVTVTFAVAVSRLNVRSTLNGTDVSRSMGWSVD